MSQQVLTDINNIPFQLPADDNAWFQELVSGLTRQEAQSLGEPSLRTIAHMMARSFIATSQAIRTYNQTIAQRILDYIDEVETNINADVPDNAAFTNLRDLVNAKSSELSTLTNLVNTNGTLLTNVNTQLQQLPLSAQGGGGSRQPKIGELPEFNGTDGKVSFNEWLDKVQLWVVHEGVTTDRQRIAIAMNKLSGAAARYMRPWIQNLASGGTIGTWPEFISELRVQYGQKDEKEGAKKELTALFANKDLAQKDFVKYAERFRTLGRLTGYDDELLIDKLDLVVEKDMRLVLIGYKRANQLPTKWTEFLDLLLDIYKNVHPEKAQDKIFSKDKDNHGAPMDVDSAESKKGKKKQSKGKSREVNAADKNTNKYCHICKMKNHNTEECRYNSRKDKLSGSSGEKKKDERKKEEKPKGHKVRSAETGQGSDDEETSTPKSLKVDSAELAKTTHISELDSDEDEPSVTLPLNRKRKNGKFKAKDFLQGTL